MAIPALSAKIVLQGHTCAILSSMKKLPLHTKNGGIYGY